MKKLYVELAALLQTKAEDVEAMFTESKEDGLIALVTKFKAENKIYSNVEFDTMQTNLKNDYVSELSKLAKEGKAPKEIHSVIKGSVLEQTTKQLADKYGITESVSSLEDLVSKLQKADVSADKIKGELEDFKTKHLNVVNDYEAKLQANNVEKENFLVHTFIESNINKLPLKVEDEKRPKQIEMLNTLVKTKYQPKWDGDKKQVVFYEGDKPVRDEKTLEPLGVDVIYRRVGEEYGIAFKEADAGGRGEGDAGGGTKLTKEQFIASKGGASNMKDADYKEFNTLFAQS
jgi:hypothetical protein